MKGTGKALQEPEAPMLLAEVGGIAQLAADSADTQRSACTPGYVVVSRRPLL